MGRAHRWPLARLMPASGGPWLVYAIFLAGWCVPPVVARGLMNLGRGVSPGLVDVRGFLSDVLVGLACAVVAMGILRVRRTWMTRASLAVVALFWALFNYAASEHVRALDATIDLRLLGYLGDETFLAGSSTMIEHPLVLLCVALFALVAVHRAGEHLDPSRRVLGGTAAGLGVILLVTRLWSPSVDELSWRQLHFLESAPMSVVSTMQVEPVAQDDPRIVEMFRPNLDGTRKAAVPDVRPNVLLVMVEGMTGAYVPPIAEANGLDYHLDMSRIGERAQREGMYFSSFINHQRQTNRGEYALLCGDYPKLSSETSKMSEYVIAADRPCLPEVLRGAGYHTAYLQAANLRFMMKDQFMSRAGFDEVRGAEYFREGYASSGWGVDDLALYEGVLAKLVEYEQRDEPWFASVLTVGTHAPFPVPDDFEGDPGEPARERSFRYADLALDELLDGLEREGLADHTLVLITSDESAGLDGDQYDRITHMLGTNWGALIAFGPGLEPEHDRAVFGQSDVAVSVLDYLGLDEQSEVFSGRSFFRHYDTPRDVGFANAYSHVQFVLTGDGRLTMCPETGDGCVGHTVSVPGIFSAGPRASRPLEEDLAFLRGVVARADVTAASRTRDAMEAQALDLIAADARRVALEPRGKTTPILSGQAIFVPEDSRYHVQLRYRVVGEGTKVSMENALLTRGETIRFQPSLGDLRDGDTVDLEYVFTPGRVTYDVDVVLRAEAHHPDSVGGGVILVEKATARLERIEPGAEVEPGFDVRAFSLEHADGRREPLPYHRLGLDSSTFWRSRCVAVRGGESSGRWRGSRCREGEVIRGPASFVPAGGRARARVVLRGVKGVGRGHIELRFASGEERHGNLTEYGRHRSFAIAPGERVELEFDEMVAVDSERTTVYVVLDETEPLTFEIEDLQFQAEPPATLVRWKGEGESP